MIYFQWVNGPKIGNVVKYMGTEIEDGVLYIKLSDGSRCNRDYMALLNETNINDKQIAHISSLENKWDIYYDVIPEVKERYELDSDGIRHCVQPYEPSKRIKRATPPKFYHVEQVMTFDSVDKTPEKENDDIISQPIIPQKHVEEPKPIIIKKEEPKPTVTQNPVYLLCEKSKKVACTFETTMEIMIPNTALFDIAKESFDDGDTHFINYIMENLDMDIIKSQIKESIIKLYTEK